jgi:hypothetical protein
VVGAAAGVGVGAAVGALSPFLACRTSALVIRPPGPVPVTAPRSMPSAAAMRAATGEILASSGSGAAGASGGVAGASGADAAEAEAEAPLPDA